jgi:peptide/nickel transport system permease protein
LGADVHVWGRKLLRFVVDSLVILAAGAVFSALLFRLSPGTDTDARELDPRYSAKSIESIRAERARQHSLAGRSLSYFLAMSRGDLGTSESSGLPVSELMLDRLPITVRTVALGALIGFLAGAVSAGACALLLPRIAEFAASSAFLGLLSMPAGLLVLFAVFGRVPIEWAVGAAAAPRVYFYAVRLFGVHARAPYVTGALSAGVGPVRIAIFQILPALRSELAALFGFAVVTAIAAAIPAEVLSGRAGIGQLAWKSAMERDLPVVIAVTMAMIVASRAVTLISSLPARDLRPAA